ncbi:hypothetical protein BCR44DRAFT_1438688 [Catenaria anguillulae PL171]|uniref:LSM complex subunit LSm2 n=1 Tax=Catenaria anguillulae PL171 TaxID=765915 RepID=A0A1Y2HHC5_9FUNG|nr:hypothetical protein BCR44DRAFT_1438688 [Catenaria anguillulae PL171]
MLFYSFFKSLVNQEVTVELKNDMSIKGTIQSVDQFLNIKLDKVQVQDTARYPHVMTLKNCFIRGSTVRYVHLNPKDVDVQLMQDATRREASATATRK